MYYSKNYRFVFGLTLKIAAKRILTSAEIWANKICATKKKTPRKIINEKPKWVLVSICATAPNAHQHMVFFVLKNRQQIYSDLTFQENFFFYLLFVNNHSALGFFSYQMHGDVYHRIMLAFIRFVINQDQQNLFNQ